MFTDYYGEQSCAAGRAAFVTGRSPFRVGLTKVGMPGARQGISVVSGSSKLLPRFAASYRRQFGELPSQTMRAGNPSR